MDTGFKGIYQDEYTIGLERLLSPTFSVGVKATYRRLGSAIEDRCDLDYTRPETNFNSCAIMNPGSNGRFARGDVPGCNGLDAQIIRLLHVRRNDPTGAVGPPALSRHRAARP